MFVRLVFILICFFISINIVSSSYEEAYRAYVYEDYSKAIELFNETVERGEGNAETVYYLGESYLRHSLFLIGDSDYKGASVNLSKAKELLESGLNNKSFYDEYKNYLKTLKEVNEALYVIDDMGDSWSSNILLYVSIFSSFVLLILILFLFRKINRRGRVPRKAVISDELKHLVEELNSNFFKTKALLKEKRANDLDLFIEATEDRCIMLNDQFEEAMYGLREIDEELFRAEIENTRDTITEFLSRKSTLLTK